MRPEREAAVRVLLVAADTAALLALAWAVPAARAWLGAHWPLDLVPGDEALLRPVDVARARWATLLLVPVWLAVLQARGAWREPLRRPAPVGALAGTVALAGLVALAALFLAKATDVSRTVVLAFAASSLPALVLHRVALAAAARALPLPSWNVALVGPAALVGAYEGALAGRREPGVRVVARIADGPIGARLWEAVVAGPVDEVRYLGRPDRAGALEEVVQLAAELGMTVRVEAGAWDVPMPGPAALTFAPARGGALLVKRALDVVGAAVGLVLVAPALAALAAAVRLQDGGPAFFVQERAGLHGRPFRMLKLRTMVPDADARRAALEPFNETGGPPFKMRDDPRVTPLGRWLRRWSLDELPQLLHVLLGDMSLVGPRPATLDEVARYDRRQRRRLAMRPGLTCTWQVSGRSELDWATWMALDLRYVDTWTLARDLEILARTVPAVLSGRGAR